MDAFPLINPFVFSQMVQRVGPKRDPGQAALDLFVDAKVRGAENREEQWALLAMVLSLVEEDSVNLQRAILMAEMMRSPEAMQTVHGVVAVRRDAQAIQCLRQNPYAREIGIIVKVSPWAPSSRPKPCPLGDLRRTVEAQGGRLLRVLKQADSAHPYDRTVALVLTTKGDVELLKEVQSEADGPLEIKDLEHGVLLDLDIRGHRLGTGQFLGFIEVEVGDRKVYFLRRTFSFGRVLADTDYRNVTATTALDIVRKIALDLQSLHERGVMVLDLRPHNILEDGTIFDLSHARRTLRRGDTVDAFMMDPRYTPPEVTLTRKGSEASDIYSLGLILKEMLVGEGGFSTLTLACHSCVSQATYRAMTDQKANGSGIAIRLLNRMLDRDPKNRPSAKEVAATIEAMQPGQGDPHPLLSLPLPADAPLALVPMRAGVPHKGHVNLICRLMDLGYRVLVSLQMAYTWTDRDPVPKWLVAKMLVAAVEDRGYAVENLEVVLTPFETQQGTHMHFLMLPQWERVQVIVSGNPEVHHLLTPICENRPMIRAEALCGDLTDANGTRLRRAMYAGDQATIEAMLPAIIRHTWPQIVEDFFPQDGALMVAMPVRVSVQVQRDEENLVPVIVRRYEFPEQAICRRLGIPVPPNEHLQAWGHYTDQGRDMAFRYIRQVFDAEEGTLVLHYKVTTS